LIIWGRHCPHHPERSAQAYVEHQIPGFVLAFPDVFELVDTGVVEQDIDSAEPLGSFLDRRLDLRALSHVEQRARNFAPESPAQLGRGFASAAGMDNR
jgi:hypothetical protein